MSGFLVRSCTIKTEDSNEYAVVLNQMKNRFDTMTERISPEGRVNTYRVEYIEFC